MAYIPRSSLIPSEASGAIPVQMKKRRTIHAFGLIATLIFVASLLSAVGVFLYKDFLNGKLTAAEEGLGRLSNEDSGRKIEEIRIYNDKLRNAQSLLKNHIAPSQLFEEIENSTKATVQFESLEFVYDPGFEAVLTLRGTTEAFAGVALQKMQLLEDSMFSDFVLRDITTEEAESSDGATASTKKGGVVFSVTGVFKNELLEYNGEVEGRNGEVTPEPQSVTPVDAEVVPDFPVENPEAGGETPVITPIL